MFGPSLCFGFGFDFELSFDGNQMTGSEPPSIGMHTPVM
jgi:hypothetical protein